MKFFSFFTMSLLWLAPAVSALSKPIEIKSENFVLIGDLSPSTGKLLIVELEKYRFAIMNLYNIEPLPEPIPVRIYTAMGSKGLKEISGRTGIGGVYTSNIEGPIFMLDAKGGFRRGQRARHYALHEYTHHLIAAYTDKFYPRWFNEGYANYLATFEIDRQGRTVIGRPYQQYVWPLSAKKWLSSEVVLGSIRRYPFRIEAGSRNRLTSMDFFYAQSWLAVHYIQSDPVKSANMVTYINLLNSEQRPKDVFAEAFGISKQEFHVELKAYYKKNDYQVLAITGDKSFSDSTLKVRNLSRGEFFFHQAEAMRYFRGRSISTQKMIDKYKSAAKKIGETPYILAGLAELATWQDDFATAKVYVDRALQLAPNNPKVNHMAGMILVYKNEEQKVEANVNELRKARKHLIRSLRGNPDNISAHYYYAKTFGLTNEPPNKQALASAVTALDYYRGINFVDSNLMLVDVLIRGGRTEIVRPAIQRAIVWGGNSATAGRALELRSYLDAKAQ